MNYSLLIKTIFFASLFGLRTKASGAFDPYDDDLCECEFEDTAYIQNTCGPLPFMKLLETLIMSRDDLTDSCRRAGTSSVPKNSRFDFIIVGAGVAGSVVAKRLSDNPRWRVLLIEAGPEQPTITSVPGLLFSAFASKLNWNFVTEPTEPKATACLDTDGHCNWPRGKMVAGSGGINGMMYWRGHPHAYDLWAQLGNPGWSYNEVKKYFERAENVVNTKLTTFDKFNTGNPLVIDHFSHQPPFADELLKAASELGYKTSGLREYKHTGFSRAPSLVKNGQRGTTARYYLRPSDTKKNLHVLINAHVTKILFNKSNNQAYGVKVVLENHEELTFSATKEVILSAGALGSPHILLNSGVGPKADLQKLNISVIQDLPVGRNLQNHVSIQVEMSIKADDHQTLTMDALNEYVANHTGPLSSTALTQITAFYETPYAKPGIPDIQTFFNGFGIGCSPTGLAGECSYKVDSLKCPARRPITARPTVLNTKSRGYMTLRSNNPLDRPLFYPNYFTNRMDMKVLIAGIKKVIEIIDTPTMKKWDMKLNDKPHPKCESHKLGSDEYWECLIRFDTGAENHQAGTCRMTPDGVVDPYLRVRGISNLRVVDASVIPVLAYANPMGSIIMIAEKASDIINQFWTKRLGNTGHAVKMNLMMSGQVKFNSSAIFRPFYYNI